MALDYDQVREQLSSVETDLEASTIITGRLWDQYTEAHAAQIKLDKERKLLRSLLKQAGEPYEKESA